jgi:uncharacterized damage-inducible protein DinB
MSEPIAPFFTGWRQLNDRLIETISSLTADELAWTPAPSMWPIWALAGHLAGARVYWLCHVLKEPGAERTPFTDPSGEGWEDDPAHPRDADELASALRSTWSVIEECLERWTPEMLLDEFRRERNGATQIHTRQSVLFRLLTHDASHSGEISQTLGSHGRGEIDLWSHLSRTLTAPRDGRGRS